MKKCPYCGEQIQDEAIICRFCDRSLQETKISQPPTKRAHPLDILFVAASACLLWLIFSRLWPDPASVYASIGYAMGFGGQTRSSSAEAKIDFVWDIYLYWQSYVILLIAVLAVVLSIVIILRGIRAKSGPAGWIWVILGVVLAIYPIFILVVDSYYFKLPGVCGSMGVAAVFFLGGFARQMTVPRVSS